MRRWYQINKASHIGYARNRDGKIQEWFREYKRTLACEVCGENHPARLDFHHRDPREKKVSISARRETTPCGEEVVLPEFGRRAHLPENKTVPVEILPREPGEYQFTCGMNMYRGRLIVR